MWSSNHWNPTLFPSMDPIPSSEAWLPFWLRLFVLILSVYAFHFPRGHCPHSSWGLGPSTHEEPSQILSLGLPGLLSTTLLGLLPPPITLNSHCVNQPLTQTMTIDGHTPWKPDLLIQPGGWASPPTFHVFFFLQKPILDHSLSRLTTMYCYEFCPSWPTLKYNSSKTYWKWNSHLNSWGAEVESH